MLCMMEPSLLILTLGSSSLVNSKEEEEEEDKDEEDKDEEEEEDNKLDETGELCLTYISLVSVMEPSGKEAFAVSDRVFTD